MSSQQIQYQVTNDIVEITLNRPEKRNALTPQMCKELRDCFDRFSQSEARVAILKSSDDAIFCAGADLTNPPELFWQAVPELGFHCDKPIIAAISGKAIGAGLILAMMCDFVVMTESATLLYPEAKLGVDKGAMTALVKRAPLRIAMELMMFGEPLGAQRAYETGMINAVVPDDQHIIKAHKMAQQLAQNAPLVVQMIKRMSLDAAGQVPIQTFYDTSIKLDTVLNSDDAAQALSAFQAKQKPIFKSK